LYGGQTSAGSAREILNEGRAFVEIRKGNGNEWVR